MNHLRLPSVRETAHRVRLERIIYRYCCIVHAFIAEFENFLVRMWYFLSVWYHFNHYELRHNLTYYYF